ncbi:SEL1-like repeat protein, partial [bacterium]|nr:SEL1-like repeat protein [bacterium]
QVLFEAFSRNPLNSAAGFELAEIYKHEGRNEAFFEVTKSCYELLYRPIDIARYFRNLGYYFIEIQNWDMAIGAYYESIYWDDSVIAHHQLLYITQRMEKEAEPPEIRDTFLVALTELCIPIPPNFLWENVALTLITNPSNSIESQSLLYVLSLISKWSGSTCELEKSKVFERAFEIVLQGGKHNPESEEISLDLLIAKAEEGDSYAACGLAIFYKSGLNIDRNEESYRDWISNAANLGTPFAMFVLGKQLLGSASEFVELELATDWLKKAALAGVDVAQHYLGSCYQFEIGVKEDLEQAIEWRKKAAEQGLPIALRYLAHGFKEGGILNKDIDRAIFFYIRAAVHGDIDSQFLLAGFYKRGEYVDQSNEKYLYWTKKAADQGDVASQYLLGKHFSNEDSRDFNVAKAFQCYLNIANHGIRQKSEEPVDRYYPSACRFQEEEFRKVNDPIITGAQSLVALSYRVGNGIEKDLQEAVFWFKKAAERGDPDAQFDLGIAYKDGQEVEKDDDLAFSWFQKAAHQGHQRAQYELSRLYAGESNPNYDKPLAIEWCKKSADQGYELAQHTLGICYLTGNGVDRDHQKANHWISLAADQRVQESKDALSSFTNMPEDFELKLQKLADLKKSKEALDEKLEVLETKRRFIQSLDTYFNEKSPNYDPELGLRACIEAAEDGDSEAQHLLGRYYYEGAIVEKNFEKALSFFHLAAEQRNPESQYQLFYMYYHGEGTEVDSYEAYKWVKEAAENGHTEAQYTLGSNYKTGDYLEEDLDLSVYWFQKAA